MNKELPILLQSKIINLFVKGINQDEEEEEDVLADIVLVSKKWMEIVKKINNVLTAFEPFVHRLKEIKEIMDNPFLLNNRFPLYETTYCNDTMSEQEMDQENVDYAQNNKEWFISVFCKQIEEIRLGSSQFKFDELLVKQSLPNLRIIRVESYLTELPLPLLTQLDKLRISFKGHTLYMITQTFGACKQLKKLSTKIAYDNIDLKRLFSSFPKTLDNLRLDIVPEFGIVDNGSGGGGGGDYYPFELLPSSLKTLNIVHREPLHSQPFIEYLAKSNVEYIKHSFQVGRYPSVLKDLSRTKLKRVSLMLSGKRVPVQYTGAGSSQRPIIPPTVTELYVREDFTADWFNSIFVNSQMPNLKTLAFIPYPSHQPQQDVDGYNEEEEDEGLVLFTILMTFLNQNKTIEKITFDFRHAWEYLNDQIKSNESQLLQYMASSLSIKQIIFDNVGTKYKPFSGKLVHPWIATNGFNGLVFINTNNYHCDPSLQNLINDY
ncbi:hypothetical protein DFA_05605 [Cavenderia fasciculata]|uniref:Uncharacterized protein n=1 Tax=Cavenderia fasciculata TaxID=261658 RepID=F4PLQ0_CACFS|nr:uncharacterized protein DFA_05605 [Cavenderia fasciculata]EGG23472.1 hypothetical protein DFA_05605 [Cavenderia fasciculata]|eukprot:XP_004361323.1 hypothetical protein DFA_05605 [Cavenderia fasciculata]